MARRHRSEVVDASPHDNIYAYEAVAVVKKLGLSMKKDQDIVINMVTEIATLKQGINSMENEIEQKNERIKELERRLRKKHWSKKEEALENREWESLEYAEMGIQCSVEIDSSFTQTAMLELVSHGTETEDLSRVTRDQKTATDDLKEENDLKDANVQCNPVLVNARVQCDAYQMIDREMQCVEVNKEESSNHPVVSHTINTIKYACSMIENSLNFQKDLFKSSITTQTDDEDTIETAGESRKGSLDSSSRLPPIVHAESIKITRSPVNKNSGYYHRQCIPPKRRGRTWIF